MKDIVLWGLVDSGQFNNIIQNNMLNKHMQADILMYTHTCTHTHVDTYTGTHTYMYTPIYTVFLYRYTYIHTYTHPYIHYPYTGTHTYMYTHQCTNTPMHTHTHRHTTNVSDQFNPFITMWL